jgi:putative ABC transport system permease protein
VGVSSSQSASEVQKVTQAPFEIITYLLLAMAILTAVVGSIGLTGTTSINVVERGREIGVMRAIGATSPAVAGIFVLEGVVIGVLSWLLALPLSYPGALVFGRMIGQTILNADLYFRYSVAGALLWLAIVVVLSVLASLWPALRATRVSVREALAYE